MSHTSITKANATKVRNAKRGTWDVLSWFDIHTCLDLN
jgi:hypothetical protein